MVDNLTVSSASLGRAVLMWRAGLTFLKHNEDSGRLLPVTDSLLLYMRSDAMVW